MHTVIETAAYLRAAKDAGMTDEEMAAAVEAVSNDPDAGDLIQGTGGFRKRRLAGRGKGKSGGYRLITYAERPGRDRAPPNRWIEEPRMSKKAFDKIMGGLNETLDIVEGRAVPSTYRVHIPAAIDTRAIRARMNLSQAQFADRYGLSAAAIRDWEQGRRVPEAGTRAFLTVLSKEPEAVERALAMA